MPQVLGTFWSNPLPSRVTLSSYHFFTGLVLQFLPKVQNSLIDIIATLGQFPPNCYMVLLSCWVLWQEHCIELTVKEFKLFYHSYLHKGSIGWYHFNVFSNHILIDKFLGTNKG